jgi:hypothetical protein
MSEDKIRYDILASEALRGIIRTVLQRVLKRGLPGDHHFYITFDTTASGAIISKRLKEQYPLEMTIVMQHQFWDLAVYDDRFEVKLSFNNVPERLVIPFSAIKSFVDPSVQFGFNPNLFAPIDGAATLDDHEEIEPPVSTPARTALPSPGRAQVDALEPAAASAKREPTIKQVEQPVQPTAKVVELDLFRKK